MWKINYKFIQKIVHNTKGMIVNYAFVLVTLIVFGQVSEEALMVYGIALPYLLIGIALAEGMEMAIFNAASRNPDGPIGVFIFFQWGLAIVYELSSWLIPRSQLISEANWKCIGMPLIACYAIYIGASVFSGLLKAQGSVRTVYYINLSVFIILIVTAVWEAIQGNLTAPNWSKTILIIAAFEFCILALAAIQKKLHWGIGKKQVFGLMQYVWYAAPMVVALIICALDRYWLNWLLAKWDKLYIGALSSWFQIKPLFLFPAIATGQMMIRYWNERVAGDGEAKNHLKKIMPAVVILAAIYIFIALYVSANIDVMLYSVAPHLEDTIHEMHWVVFFDATMIPLLAIVLVSRLMLESEQKGWRVCCLLVISILISRGFLMVFSFSLKSVTLLTGSFMLQMIVLVTIPIYFWRYLSQKKIKTA